MNYEDRKWIKDLDPVIVADIIADAYRASIDASNGSFNPVGGCGRVYVNVGKINKRSKVFERISRHFRVVRGDCLYIGYDNGTGKEFAMGEAVNKVLRDHGLHSYVSAEAD